MKNYENEDGFRYYMIKFYPGCYSCDNYFTLEEAKKALEEYKKECPDAKIVVKLEIELD